MKTEVLISLEVLIPLISDSMKSGDSGLGDAISDVMGTIYRSLVLTPADVRKAVHRAEYHLELCIGKDKVKELSLKLKDSLKLGRDFKGFSKRIEPSLVKYVPLIMHLHQLQQFAKLL